ncbi:MAG: sigma-70 family RNA polymerase sigma factor [Candidatus Paceibacterota bacterium]|jgi:RNA polymerase sigma-70 factor (ECF subfamily)
MENIEKLSDEKLVELVRTKDQELYAEIVKRYQDRLLRYVLYLIKNRQKAEDAVQNTFIKAFINLMGFSTKQKFSSWIYRIAHNEAINIIKKHRKEILLDKDGWDHHQLLEDRHIYKQVSDKETKEQIKRYLSLLPLKYREPITLFYLEEKSYKEISDILRISIGGVGARINRAKIMLQKNIKI